jgi:hypothetical protein
MQKDLTSLITTKEEGLFSCSKFKNNLIQTFPFCIQKHIFLE